MSRRVAQVQKPLTIIYMDSFPAQCENFLDTGVIVYRLPLPFSNFVYARGGMIGKQLQSGRISAELPLGEKASGQKNVECRPQCLTTSFMLTPGLILAATNLT